jgi:probable LLM family oxidoreductase
VLGHLIYSFLSMELGVYTFAEMTTDPSTGKVISTHQRIQYLMEEIELAEQTGLDIYAVGEHHRPDFAISSPAIILAAAAVKTNRIKLSSAVTVLSSDDPVRVYQDFATIDHLSSGRAEIMAGRGSFIESFPLFGYDLKHYDELFSEKLELLLKINDNEKVTWAGKHRAPINNLGVYPRAMQKRLPIWVAIGGTPESIARAASLGLPMALAIIGGMPSRFVPHVNFYRQAYSEASHPLEKIQIGINSHAFVAETSREASRIFYPSYAELMTRIGKERGWPPMDREHYEMMRSAQGSLLVGSPQEVVDKILYEHELFGNTRFLAQMSVGTIPHDKLMRSIELFGTVVAPAVRKALRK